MKISASLCLILLLLLLFASSSSSQSVVLKSKPNSAKECAVCHYEMAEIFVTMGKGTEIAPYPKNKEVSTERMCFSCHDGSVADSRLKVWDGSKKAHKTGVALKDNMTVSPLLPLEDGKITCATCHSAHGTIGSEGSFGDIANSLFLRMPIDDSQLCKTCHTDMAGKDSHSMEKADQSYISKVLKKGGFVSKNSKVTCVSCHTVHGSTEEKLVLDNPLNEKLCRICHENLFTDLATGAAVKTPHISYKKPINKNAANEITLNGGKFEGKDNLVCYSCHTVHKAKGKSILNFTGKDEDFCVKCHENFNKMTNSPHNLTKSENNYKTVDGKTSREAGLCGSCHGGHKWNLSTGLTTPEDRITGLCMNCHNPYGAAAKKAIDLNSYNHYTGPIALKLFNRPNPKDSKELTKNSMLFLKTFTMDKQGVLSLLASEKVSCMTCHDIHGDKKSFIREETANGKLCISCHESKSVSLKTPHGADKVNSTCLGCHKIHNSEVKSLVIDGGKNDGCLSCHSEDANSAAKLPAGMKDKMPAELIFKGHNHPYDIDNSTIFPAPAYSKKDGKFSCASCHDPHVSDKSSVMKGNFVRTDKSVKSPDDFCALCHEKEKPVLMSSHAADPKKPFVANSRTGRLGGSCDRCHAVHNANADKGIPVIKWTYETPSDLCINCHRDNGDAKNKMIDISKGHATGLLKSDDIPENIKRDFLIKEKGSLFLYCQVCHDPHLNGPKQGSDGDITNSFLKTLDELGKNSVICVSCHDTKEKVKTAGHGAANFDSKNKDDKTRLKMKNNDICGVCHEMHNSPKKYLMAGDTNKDRCMSCHDSSKMSDKIVAMYHRDDVEVKKDDKGKLPLESDKITCKTCHKTHGDSKNLIRSQTAKSEDLCVTCHDEQKPVILSKHNMNIGQAKDKKLAENSIGSSCEACHSSHDPHSPTAIRLGEKSRNEHHIEDACLKCHGRGKPASDKIPEVLRHSSIFKILKAPDKFDNFTYGPDGRKAVNGVIDCATCHDPHTWSVNPLKLQEVYKAGLKIDGDNSTSFLKDGVKNDFCIVCHEKPDEWYDKFHSKKYRDERLNAKEPRPLLERLFNLFR